MFFGHKRFAFVTGDFFVPHNKKKYKIFTIVLPVILSCNRL